jgi:hypothetical protein
MFHFSQSNVRLRPTFNVVQFLRLLWRDFKGLHVALLVVRHVIYRRKKTSRHQHWRKTFTVISDMYSYFSSYDCYNCMVPGIWFVVKYKIVCITQKCSKLTHNTLFNVCRVLCWAVKLNSPFPKGKKVRRLQLSCSILYARKMDKISNNLKLAKFKISARDYCTIYPLECGIT